MNLSTGSRLGPYEILAPLGAGGMGEVYRARDAKLGRDIAVDGTMDAPSTSGSDAVLTIDRYLTFITERALAAGASRVSKDELLATSDVVTLHLKLSDRTIGIVGARELALMKRSAYLVNTSRGPLVDEAALVEALRGHRIAGAGLDVFDVEPLPADHPLRALPNTVLTPHIGYVTAATYAGWWQQIVGDIGAWQRNVAVRQL